MQETVRLRLLADNMFEFARRKEEEIREPVFTEGQVENALGVLRLEDIISDERRGRWIKDLASNVKVAA